MVLVAIVLAAIAWSLVPWRNPLMNGPGESFRIKRLETLSPQDVDEWQALGTSGVPTLIKALETEPSALARVYSNALSKLPSSLKNSLPAPQNDVNIRIGASVVLANADVATNVPLSVLAHALQDPAWQVRVNALNCLYQVVLPKAGPEKAEILSRIEAAAQDPYYEVRMCAANCLGFYRNASNRVAPILTKALKDNYPDVRIRAAMAFHALDPALAEDAGAIAVAFDCLMSGGIHGSRYLATNFLQELGKLPRN